MKYMLMMQFKVGGWATGHVGNWPAGDRKRNADYLARLNRELSEAGELVSVEGLGGPEGMKIVNARTDSAPAITDGPFPESKEFLAGFWIVDVEKPERAYEIAARISSLPGRGGVAANVPIEVRPVMGHRASDL